MSTNNNNLGTFLKKRSLFANSPEKTGTRKRSTSREPKDVINNYTPTRQEYNNSIRNNLQNKNSTSQLRRQFQQEDVEFNYSDKQGSDQRWPKNDKTKSRNLKNPELQEEQRRKGFNKQIEVERQPERNRDRKNINDQPKSNKKWVDLVNHTVSFESARIESIQCLEGLSVKIQGQISNINYKLQVFNSKMNTMITNQFRNLKERIYEIVEKVFIESEKTIRSYMKIQQDNLAGDLIRMKQNLQKQYIRIQTMKEDINKPGWRKVAGQLLSSEMQQTMEEMLRKSSSISIGHWQIGDLGGTKIRVLEEHLKDIVKLQR